MPPSLSLTGDYDTDDEYHSGLHTDGDDDDLSKPSDRDGDSDSSRSGYFDADDNSVRRFGHAAPTSDRRAVVALVRRYFKAANDGNGVAACSMMTPPVSSSVAGDLGGAAGPRYASGTTCPAVMSKVFAHYHRQLSAHSRRLLGASDVRLSGNEGIVVLMFKALPGRRIGVARVNGTWLVNALLDLELP